MVAGVVGIVLALLASLAWGVSDFLGGMAAGSARLIFVLVGSQLAGLLLLAPVLAIGAAPPPHDPRLLLGVAAGVLAVGELGLIYTALRRGPAIVMAQIAALGAVLAVAIGIVGGDHLDLLIAVGLVLALAGTAAASWAPSATRLQRRDALIGYALAGAAAIGAGSVLTLLDAASRAGALWAAGALRVGGAVTAMVALACAPAARRVARTQLARAHGLLAMIVAVGVSDAVADLAFASAARHGQLSVVAVLASLYPVATIGLGAIVLRERPARVQLLGAALALGGVAVLGAATH
jgi:drug/metabolite transporter (DMT)-like permease